MHSILGILLAAVASTSAGGAEVEPAPKAVYGVAQIQIEDRETYRKYEQGFAAIFSRYGGEMIGMSESPLVIEGEWPWTRTVMLRFPSLAEFEAWYYSTEYQELSKLRKASSKANLIMIEAQE